MKSFMKGCAAFLMGVLAGPFLVNWAKKGLLHDADRAIETGFEVGLLACWWLLLWGCWR